MLKRLLVISIFMLAVWTARAQDPAWTALMYDAYHGHVVRVGSDGGVLQDLTLPDAAGQYPPGISVSPGGRLLAFMATDQLVIYDMDAQAETQTVALPDFASNSIGVYPQGDSFNDDETLLAVGYMRDLYRWQIDVYDVSGGALQYRLRDNDAAMPQFLGDYEAPLVPAIQRFDGTQITFTIVVLTEIGDWRYASFEWDLLTNEVSPNSVYNALDSDTFAGEVVTPAQNSLHIFSDATLYPFYSTSDASLSHPRFVQNGERIAVTSVSASGVASILLLERDGTLVDEFETIYISDVIGLSDGFIYAMNTPSATQNTTLLYAVSTREGRLDAGKLIWAGESGPSYTLIWADDVGHAL